MTPVRIGASELFGPEDDGQRRVTVGASELFGPEISEAEANQTLTPEESAKVVPEFGAGTAKRMAEYRGLSPEQASAKYRQGWADTFSGIYDTVTDPVKLGGAVHSAIGAGAHAITHPTETINRVGNYYYENPDAAATDLAFAAFPGRQAVEKGASYLKRPPSNAMPRASVRDGDELVKTGGLRMKIAKLDPAKVDPSDIAAPMQRFRERMAGDAIELNSQFVAPELMRRIGRLEGAFTPTPRGAMYNITKKEPAAKPPVSLGELHKHKQGLNKFIDSAGKTEGKINEQGHIALALKDSVDEMIRAHPESPEFFRGTNEVRRGKMSEFLDEIEERARGRPQWKNGDEAGALQNELSQTFRGRHKNRHKVTPEAYKKLKRLSNDNKGRLIGAFGATNIGGFTFGRAAEVAMGLYPGTMAVAGVPVRAARNKRFMEEFKRIQEELRAGGPVE